MKPVEQMSNQEITAEALRLAGDIQRTTGAPHEKALAAAQRHLGLTGISVINQQSPAERDAEDARLEKEIVAHADKQLRALGFRVIGLSQPRATKQTPGIPDRLYFHRERDVAVWWEAKTPTGVQSPAQKDFQDDCDAVGWHYVLGPDTALFAWLVARGIACEEGGLLVPLPYTQQERTA